MAESKAFHDNPGSRHKLREPAGAVKHRRHKEGAHIHDHNNMDKMQAGYRHTEPEPLPHISAHILRHTACTRLAESGLEPKVLQYIMGHANVSITLDIYTHLDFSQIQKKMEKVQENTMIG